MHVQLVGADFEENLGMGMIAATAQAAGHRVEVLAFNQREQVESLARKIADDAADLVGIAMQFQHRASDFLALARRVRQLGFRGHLTAGGHHATAAYHEVLADGHGLDSIIMHEGEQTIVDLLAALRHESSLHDIKGLAFVLGDKVIRNPGRCLAASLDELPFASRYRAHGHHVGVPFIPIVGSRGCWGSCSFCSITSFFKDARRNGGGKGFRLRSPENIAQEMALLTHAAGTESAIFCFHDDNFLLPRPEDSLERVRELRAALDDYAVGKVAIVGKCRPDSMTAELARSLRELGVIRLYVGIENTSPAGAEHLHFSAIEN
jgi:anaerobic magnesium-protoporphyrin IX monomethyl ester cyclase